MTAVKVIKVPTDKSMPPVMITNVQAIASTPFTAVACRIPSMLSICMNEGDAKLKKISNRIRLPKASSFCSAVGEKTRARRPNRRPCLASAEVSDGCVMNQASPFRSSGCFQGVALRRELHDALLRRLRGGQFARNAALAHHHDAVAHAQDFRQFRRDHHDRLALFSKRAQQFVDF